MGARRGDSGPPIIPELGDRNLVSNGAHKSSFDLESCSDSVRAFSGTLAKRDEPDRCLRLR